MSTRAQLWAAARTDLDPATRWTLWHLADFAHEDGTSAFPSVRRLAERQGISDRTVQRHLSELLRLRFIEDGDQGLVAHYPANRRPHVWSLRMNAGQLAGVAAFANRPSTAVDKPVDNLPAGVPAVTPQGAARGDTDGITGVSLVSPNPRTRDRTTRGRARLSTCGQPDCVGGWLPDDPLTRLPVACPTCGRHTRRTPRLGVT